MASKGENKRREQKQADKKKATRRELAEVKRQEEIHGRKGKWGRRLW